MRDEAAEILQRAQNAPDGCVKTKRRKNQAAQCDRVLKVDKEKLCRINAMGQMCISSRHAEIFQ